MSVTFDSCVMHRISTFCKQAGDQSECHSPQISVNSHVSMITTERLQPVSEWYVRQTRSQSTDGKRGYIPLQFLIV